MVVKHEPKTFAELQKFYTDVYTPLYDSFINSGAAPQELHAEAAACLDHLFCHANGDVGERASAYGVRHTRRLGAEARRQTFRDQSLSRAEDYVGDDYKHA